MTIKNLCGAIGAVCLSLTLASSAFGQACSQNLTITAANAPAGVAGNNCNANLTQAKICGNGDTLNQAGIDIYRITLGAGNNFNVTVTSSAFAPTLSMTSTTTCSSNAPCLFDNAPAGNATAPFSVTANPSGLAAGNYYLFVSDTGADAPGCGAYNLVVTTTLPVELKNFSVD